MYGQHAPCQPLGSAPPCSTKANEGNGDAPECKQLEKEMATVLGRIETGKESWLNVKSEAKQLKEDLLKIEEEITSS